MQRRKYEVSRLSQSDSCFDRREVAHLTDDNHIRIFAQDRSYPTLKAVKVFSELSLMKERGFVRKYKLDRIFEGDDMSLHVRIDIVEHGCHGGGFTTSCWSCEEDDAFFCMRHLEEVLWDHDFLFFWYDG